jgi:hypothetical protein
MKKGNLLANRRLNDSPGANAASADTHLPAAAGYGHADLLQVWQPATSGFVVGVTDIIAGFRLLAAYFTYISHGKSSLSCFLIADL